jgi:hypothetical protein
MCFRRITRNFKSDYFLAPARTFIFADAFYGMHHISSPERGIGGGETRREIILDRFAGGLRNTDGQ